MSLLKQIIAEEHKGPTGEYRGGTISADFDPGRIDSHDVTDLILDMAVQAAAEGVKEEEKKYEKMREEEDPPFQHTESNYLESADLFIQDIRDKIMDITNKDLMRKINEVYGHLWAGNADDIAGADDARRGR